MDTLSELKSNLDDLGIFLSFSGPISQDLMVELGETLKKQMAMAEAETTKIIKVFSVLVEQSQNIIHHSAEKIPEENNNNEKLMFGTIAVGYSEGKYFVIGGNRIKVDQKEFLKEKLSHLQKMNTAELNKYFRKQRKEISTLSDKGAGLGLIDLARKASEPIEFDFVDIDEEYSFFSLKTIV